MQQSRRELVDQALRQSTEIGDGDARTKMNLLLNTAILNIWLAHPWSDHRLPNPVQVTTVANQSVYPLPQYFGRVPPMVTALKNLTTARPIGIVSQDVLEAEYPEAGTSLEQAGTPSRAFIGSPVGVSVQPSSSGQALEVVSDNAADVAVRVLVEGVNGNGDWDETQVTLTGTVAVAVGTWKAPLITFSKAYPAGIEPATPLTSSVGTVTLRVVAGATLQTLLPEESAREFPSLRLYPKPVTSGEIIGVPTLRAPKRLLYDADMCPRFWGSAILEELLAIWASDDGESARPVGVLGPQLLRLIGHDNSLGPRHRTRPFMG